MSLVGYPIPLSRESVSADSYSGFFSGVRFRRAALKSLRGQILSRGPYIGRISAEGRAAMGDQLYEISLVASGCFAEFWKVDKILLVPDDPLICITPIDLCDLDAFLPYYKIHEELHIVGEEPIPEIFKYKYIDYIESLRDLLGKYHR